MSFQESRSLILAVGGREVGLAVRASDGFRFVATDPDFCVLDGSRFLRLDLARAAVFRLAGAIAPSSTAIGGGSAAAHDLPMLRYDGM